MTVLRIRERRQIRSATRPPAWFNRLTIAVLRSPLHRLADSDVCVLSFTGRRSGRPISVPVLYAARGDTLIVLVGDAADKQWWRNFHQPRDLQVRCHGRTSAATARVAPRSDPDYPIAATAYRERHHVDPRPGDRLLIINPRSS
jgi:hypothetical protein